MRCGGMARANDLTFCPISRLDGMKKRAYTEYRKRFRHRLETGRRDKRMDNQKKMFDSAAFRDAYHTDVPLGAFCSDAGTHFALWAPTAQYVYLKLYENGSGGYPLCCVPMTRGEKGVWTFEDARDLHGVYYTYDVTVDGAIYVTGDPYARACGVNGLRSMVVDLSRTNPEGWESDRAPEKQAEDIVYELHVKDFTWDPACGVEEEKRGKYLGLVQEGTTLCGDGEHVTGLDYIKRLGVTHVQLLPVYDYGSVDEAGAADQFNWGYDPVNYNVPEGSYASDAHHGEVRIRELKETIAGLHKNGLRVIMDVVYNHTYSLDCPLFKAAPWYYFRQTAKGRPSNGSGCGNEVATERSMAARYILDSVMYWAEEYHMDGFRFDLMGLMDVGLMNRIQKALDKRFGKGQKLIYGEPWAGGKPHPRGGTRLAHKGNLGKLDLRVGAFSDATRDAVKGSVFEAGAPGFVSGGAFNADWLACCMKAWVGCGEAHTIKAPSQVISYLSCHDDWTLWDKLVHTMDKERRFEALSPDILRANRLAAAMLFCCQGHLFMLSGEEFGRTKLGERNSYRSPIALNRVDWKRAWENQAMVDYYRGLIALRKQLPAFCDKSEQAGTRIRRVSAPREGAALIEVDNSGAGSTHETLLVLVNCSRDVVSMLLPEGEWQTLCCADSSFVWQKEHILRGSATLAPVSALILGGKV